MPAEIAIRIAQAPNPHAVIRAARTATGLPVAEIANAVETRQPIPVGELFGASHEEDEGVVRTLLDALDKAGVAFELLVDGEAEPRTSLSNRIASWHQVADDLEMETDRRNDVPSDDAGGSARGRGK